MMMTNLFSMFDPSLSVSYSSLLSLVLVVVALPLSLWNGGSLFSLLSWMITFLKKEVNYAVSKSFKGLYSFIGSIFLMVALYNFLALFPHLFSTTSHMMVTLPLSYSLWVAIIIFTWLNFFKNALAHFIPIGTPVSLISFMSLVELLSNLIRPLALTFRLTANMMAGHLLMSLIGGALISLPFSLMMVGCLIQSLLVFMELGVSLIQAYVFSTLLLLYLSESEH